MAIPEIVFHDGGPPYSSSEWREYAKKTGFQSQLCRAYKSVYGLKDSKYRLNTDPNLKKIQTIYGLYFSKIQT